MGKHFRVIGKTLWVSRQMHDKILAKCEIFWQDNLSQKDAKWSLFGKGINCDSEKGAHDLWLKIFNFMGADYLT